MSQKLVYMREGRTSKSLMSAVMAPLSAVLFS
jgi:hypothetical protein